MVVVSVFGFVVCTAKAVGTEKIVFASDRSGNWDIWMMDPDGTHLEQLTTDPADDDLPQLSPDGSKIVFRSTRTGSYQAWIMNSDRSDQHLLFDINDIDIPYDPDKTQRRVIWSRWAPDGSYIITQICLWAVRPWPWDIIYRHNPDGSNPQIFLNWGPSIKGGFDISSDGSKFAYCREDSNYCSTTLKICVADIVNRVVDESTIHELASTKDGYYDNDVTWFNDDNKLMWEKSNNPVGCDTPENLYSMNIDETNIQKLTNYTDQNARHPDFSPNEQKVVFMLFDNSYTSMGLYVMNPDGSNIQPLLVDGYKNAQPCWGIIKGVDLKISEITPIQVVYNADINNDNKIDLVQGKATAIFVYVEGFEGLSDNTIIDVNLTFEGTTYTKSKIVAELKQDNRIIFYATPQLNGNQTIVAKVDPFNRIEEISETNNVLDENVTVKDTRGLYLTYIPVYAMRSLPLGSDPPLGYGPLDMGAYSKTVEESGIKFIYVTYPVSGEKFVTQRIDYPRYLGNPVGFPYLGMLQDAAELQVLGELATVNVIDTDKRVIGVVPDDYFNYHRIPGAGGIAFSFPPINAVLAMADYWNTPAHEIGHTYGLNLPELKLGLPPWESTEEYDVNPPGTHASGFYVEGEKDINDAFCFMGVGVPRRKIGQRTSFWFPPPPEGKYYSYTDGVWVCDDTYESLFEKFRVSPTDPEVLLVSGIIFKNGTVQLGTWYHLGEGQIDYIPTGNYSLRFLDANKATIDEIKFDAPFYVLVDPIGPVETNVTGFVFRVPFYAETTNIQLTHNELMLAERNVTPNPPIVKVIYPNGGEVLGSLVTHTITWEALDPDGDKLTYALMYSADAGATWQPLALDLTENKYKWTIDELPTGSNYSVRVIASDGVNVGMDDSDSTFTISAIPARVPTLTPFGLIVLVGVLSVIIVMSINRSKR